MHMHATRKRRPPQAVSGSCRWLVQPGTAPLAHTGCLLISATRSDGRQVTESYLVAENKDGGTLAGYRLTKSDGTAYDLDATLSSCDCPDSEFAPERPGGCKHRKALAKALASLG
jgi:hypothetical protein